MHVASSGGKKKIIIVGAGPGGLTSAMLLAHRGFDVEVFEKNASVGGRNGEIDVDGFRFDIGPTFLMMKFVLDKVFEEAGASSGERLKFTRLDPMYRLVFDTFEMDISDDPEKMKREIAKYFPGSEAGLERFLEREAKRFRAIYPCLEKDYSSWRAYLRPTFLKALPYIPFGRSLFQYLGNYFDAEKLRLSFTFQAKYLGMSPWECPGFFIILPYIEHAFGVWHVEGGLSAISRAMAAVAEKNGARIRLNTPVKRIIVEERTAKGVVLEDGREVRGDDVVINADFAYAMTHLIPPGVLKKYTPEKVAKKRYSCSTFMLYLGVDKIYSDLPHHTIVFAKDYRTNVEDIFKRFDLSQDTSVYVRNAAPLDPTGAPEGKSGLYILVPVANNTSRIDWSKEKQAFRERVLDIIESRTSLRDLRQHIVAERIITPDDWERDAHVFLGATFNLAHTLDQMLYLRPHNKFEELEHCYLVGGGTHPGSGLPTIYQSGRIAADMISRRHGVISTLAEPLIKPPEGG